jgi:hypothetical protein
MKKSRQYKIGNCVLVCGMKTLIILTSILLCLAGIGCTILSHQITPAEVDRQALQYAINAGVTDANNYNAWYPNMAEAAKLKSDVDAAHSVIQLDLSQRMESDNLTYAIHKDVTASNLLKAQQHEEMLFGEKGLLSLGLSMLGMGTLTGFLGLMRRRPQDWTPEEVESAVAQAENKSNGELAAKAKHLTQVVKGVQEFMDSGQIEPITDLLKACMDRNQDTDTQVAVATIKKENT